MPELKKLCRKCKRDKLVKIGFVTTVSEGKKIRYKCQVCGTTQY